MPKDKKPNDNAATDELNEAHRHAEPKGKGESAGEDEGSTAKEGSEDHLKDDQKTPKN